MLGDTVLIVNPQAGRGISPRQLSGIVEEAKKILSLPDDCVFLTEPSGPNSASNIARSVQKGGAKAIVAAVGDGGLHGVINGLTLPDDSIAIGIIRLGTSNVVASHFGIPRNPKKALGIVKEGITKTMDLCAVEGADLPPLCAFAASMGLDAQINERAHHLKPKLRCLRLPTIAAYPLLILRCGFNPVPLISVTINVDGNTILKEKKVTFVSITNTPRYGGGMLICPWAKVDDGVLNLTLALPMKPYEVIIRAFQMLRGTHIHHTEVFLPGMAFKTLEIIGASLMPTQMDGEPMPPQTHIKVSVFPQALRVFVPKPKPQPQPDD